MSVFHLDKVIGLQTKFNSQSSEARPKKTGLDFRDQV